MTTTEERLQSSLWAFRHQHYVVDRTTLCILCNTYGRGHPQPSLRAPYQDSVHQCLLDLADFWSVGMLRAMRRGATRFYVDLFTAAFIRKLVRGT